MVKHLIAAITHVEYFQFLGDHHLKAVDCKIVRRIEDIRGYRDTDLCYTQLSYMLDDFDAIHAYAQSHNIREHEF